MFPRKFYGAVNTWKKQRKHHGNIQKNVEINEKVFILNKKAENPQDYKETSKQTQNPNYSPKKFFIVFVQIKKIKGKNGIKNIESHLNQKTGNMHQNRGVFTSQNHCQQFLRTIVDRIVPT